MVTRSRCLSAAALMLLASALPAGAQDYFLGEIRWVGFNFAPRGWAKCDGQLLPIAQNTALFALLGTQYGGNGQTTFALPDLRSRTLVHQGQGPGLSPYSMGQTGGEESTTLTLDQMPAHNHPAIATRGGGTTQSPAGMLAAKSLANDPDGSHPTVKTYRPTGEYNTLMAPEAIGVVGGSQPHNNVPPYNTANCIIALTGIFPSRD